MADARDVRWEYCSLEHRTSHTKGGGVRETTVLVYYGKHSFTEAFDPRAWAQAVGQLGEGGWEMVSSTATYNVDGCTRRDRICQERRDKSCRSLA